MAKSISPPRFTYNVSDAVRFGTFTWDQKTGLAIYATDRSTGETFQRGIQCMTPCQYTKNGKKYPFWHFTETSLDTADPQGRTKLWLFEISPNQGFCAIYFYYTGDDDAQSFGDGVLQAVKSDHPPLV